MPGSMGQRAASCNALRAGRIEPVSPPNSLARWDAADELLLAACKPREPHGAAADALEWLLDDGADALAPGRMEDPSSAEPEADVVRPAWLAEADEVTRPRLGLVDRSRRRLLLVRVARDETPEPAVRHVY